MTKDENVPTSAGLSSFNLLDERKFFTALGLNNGMTLLDFGCGAGNYAVAAAPHIGDSGRIYAVDLWEEGVETLEVRAAMARLENIQTWVCGADQELQLGDHTVDLCLMATVIHILVQEEVIQSARGRYNVCSGRGALSRWSNFTKKKVRPDHPCPGALPRLNWQRRLPPRDCAAVRLLRSVRIIIFHFSAGSSVSAYAFDRDKEEYMRPRQRNYQQDWIGKGWRFSG
ncbi:MAG: class I SAM-dependent methyltransferase [Desulfobulbaceae bacterium]|nr:class I SAM-dependent methyltransferase [Desulfobulbaceae bacterium]